MQTGVGVGVPLQVGVKMRDVMKLSLNNTSMSLKAHIPKLDNCKVNSSSHYKASVCESKSLIGDYRIMAKVEPGLTFMAPALFFKLVQI